MIKWYWSECFWGLNKTPSQNWDNGLDGWMVSRVWRKVSGKAAQPKEAGLFWCKFVCRQTRESALTSQWNKWNPNWKCQNLNQVHFLDQFSEERQRGSNDVSLRTRWHVKAGCKNRMLRSKREWIQVLMWVAEPPLVKGRQMVKDATTTNRWGRWWIHRQRKREICDTRRRGALRAYFTSSFVHWGWLRLQIIHVYEILYR